MWINDTTIFSQINTDLGVGYHWSPEAKIDGGKLHFKDQMIKLKRVPSMKRADIKLIGCFVLIHNSVTAQLVSTSGLCRL